MGAAGSLPDGSELTAPVERVEHAVLVRANLALVFVKPHAYKPDAIDFVRSSLSAGGKVKLLGECSVGAQDIAAKGLVDQHYSTIASFATSAPASDIPATEETKAAFSEAFGANFDDMVAGGAILSAEDVAKKYRGRAEISRVDRIVFRPPPPHPRTAWPRRRRDAPPRKTVTK